MALANVCQTAGYDKKLVIFGFWLAVFDPISWGPSTKNMASWRRILTSGLA
jgi:hypothetical protein